MKHTAMWACPRSRSTVISRSFEQLEGCIIYNEPFIALLPSITEKGLDHQLETDYQKIIDKLTGDLPQGASFSFQKQSTDEYFPEFGTDWILKLTNFFLIRHPRDILASFHQARIKDGRGEEVIEERDIGIHTLHSVFEFVKSATGTTPVVISSDDVVKNPHQALEWLCNQLNITFDEKMLSWEKGIDNSQLHETMTLFHPAWAETLSNSQSFIPYKKSNVELPEELLPLYEKCMVYYNKLLPFCHSFDEK